jgi:hypothetical protein
VAALGIAHAVSGRLTPIPGEALERGEGARMDEDEKKSAGGLSVVALRYIAAILTAAAFVGGAGWLLQRRSKRKAKEGRERDEADSDDGIED